MIDNISRMDQVVQCYVKDNQFMGAVLVAQQGQILFDKGFGYANLEWQIPNTPATKFRIGSLTKQFTAASILLLEEQGKLKTTDYLNKYMLDAPSSWRAITLFHLLNHTSGISNYTSFPDFAAWATSMKTPEQQIDFFRNKPLNFQPGSNFEYSNSGYVLLGYLIEKISGYSYQEFIVNNLFNPLGMNDSGYDTHSELVPHRAAGYVVSVNGFCNADYLDMSIPYAAGSLYSTTHDLLRWEEGLFGGKIFSAKSVKKMLKPFKNDYGFGLRIYSWNGYRVISHAGGINGFNTKLIYFPEAKLTIIVLANVNALGSVAQDLAWKLARLACGKTVTLHSERTEITLSPKSLTECVGTYRMEPYTGAYGLTLLRELMISEYKGYLMLQEINQPDIQLFPESETTFFGKIPDIQVSFMNNDQGEIAHLVLHQDGENATGLKMN